VCVCVHRSECPYIYEYLYIYMCFSKNSTTSVLRKVSVFYFFYKLGFTVCLIQFVYINYKHKYIMIKTSSDKTKYKKINNIMSSNESASNMPFRFMICTLLYTYTLPAQPL
jgi:hypothetical protein